MLDAKRVELAAAQSHIDQLSAQQTQTGAELHMHTMHVLEGGRYQGSTLQMNIFSGNISSGPMRDCRPHLEFTDQCRLAWRLLLSVGNPIPCSLVPQPFDASRCYVRRVLTF